MTEFTDNREKARSVFWRLQDVKSRGHDQYVQRVQRLDDLYFGGGRMWRPSHRDQVEAEGRPAREVNTILPTINAAVGYQIANRMDIAYLPKGSRATEEGAKTMSKVIKHTLENTRYRWRETEVFSDGIIRRRGYFDIRMDYSDSLDGEVKITSPDPMDVIPDPDGKTYDPDGWADVHTCRWLTHDEIEGLYGKDAADEIRGTWRNYADEANWSTELVRRDGFGDSVPPTYGYYQGWYGDNDYVRRYRVVDKQWHEYTNGLVAVFPGGDFRVVEGYPQEHLAWLLDRGVSLVTRRIRRVRWSVCAPEVCIRDEHSPYEHFTIVPYFPIFSRGQTIGMVDNMESPAEMLNKFVSQFEHVVNSSANGGWQGEAGVLENMTDEDFTQNGAQTGLVLLRKPGTKEFSRIQPNQVPTGLDRMIDFAHNHLNIVSGVDPQGMQIDRNDMSGIALQSLEYTQQKKLAGILDNLSQTRHMVGDRVRKLVQRYMGGERVLRITEVDPYGVERRVPLAVNVRQPDGRIFNDLTAGEYDMSISERPANVTFNNSEFEQIKAMRKDMGIPIPDPVVVRASNLADKSEIAEAMQSASDKADPLAEAEAALKLANARLADQRAVAEGVKAMFAAIQTAQAIVVTPQSAALADALARSAGFKDQDAAPIFPEAPQAALPAPQDISAPGDTTPLTPESPANPVDGVNAGMTDAPVQPPK